MNVTHTIVSTPQSEPQLAYKLFWKVSAVSWLAHSEPFLSLADAELFAIETGCEGAVYRVWDEWDQRWVTREHRL